MFIIALNDENANALPRVEAALNAEKAIAAFIEMWGTCVGDSTVALFYIDVDDEPISNLIVSGDAKSFRLNLDEESFVDPASLARLAEELSALVH